MERSQEPRPPVPDLRPRIAVSYEIFRNALIGARALWIGVFLLTIILKVQLVLDRPTLEQLLGVSAAMAGFSLAVATLVVDYNRDRRLVAAFLLVGYTFLVATGLWITGLFSPLPVSIELLVVGIIVISAVGDLTTDAISRRRSKRKIFYLWTFASVSIFPIGIAPLGAPTMGMALTVGAFTYLLAFVAVFAFSVFNTKQATSHAEEDVLGEKRVRRAILQILNVKRPDTLTTDEVKRSLANRGFTPNSYEVGGIIDSLRRQGKIYAVDPEGKGAYTVFIPSPSALATMKRDVSYHRESESNSTR